MRCVTGRITDPRELSVLKPRKRCPYPNSLRSLRGGVPVEVENIDTDQSRRALKATERKGFGDNLFRDWRYDAANRPIATFPLNDPMLRGQILVAAELRLREFARTRRVGSADYGFRVVVVELLRHFSATTR